MTFSGAQLRAIFENKCGLDGYPRTLDDLAQTVGVTPRTVSRWVNGYARPSRANINRVCQILRCMPKDLKLETVSPAPPKIVSEGARNALVSEIMRRRGFLGAAGAVALCPFGEGAELAGTAERYESVRAIAEIAGAIPRWQRLAWLRDLDDRCWQAARTRPSRDNHLVAAMVAAQRAISTRRNYREALEIARRATLHAEAAGQQVVKTWAAVAQGSVFQEAGEYGLATAALESVVLIEPERGTMQVFAMATLAEIYAAEGDATRARQALELVPKFRDAVQIPDEFGGAMTFPRYQELAHGARTALLAGNAQQASQLFDEMFDEEPSLKQAKNSSFYRSFALETAAIAALEQGNRDEAFEYARFAASSTNASTQLLVSCGLA